MDDERVIAHCAECGNDITTNDSEIYVDQNGNYFDSVECVLEHHGITKLEI